MAHLVDIARQPVRCFWEVMCGEAVLIKAMGQRGWTCAEGVGVKKDSSWNVLNPLFFVVLLSIRGVGGPGFMDFHFFMA